MAYHYSKGIFKMNKSILTIIIYGLGIIIGALFLDIWSAETSLIKAMSVFIWTAIFLIALFYADKKDRNDQE